MEFAAWYGLGALVLCMALTYWMGDRFYAWMMLLLASIDCFLLAVVYLNQDDFGATTTVLFFATVFGFAAVCIYAIRALQLPAASTRPESRQL